MRTLTGLLLFVLAFAEGSPLFLRRRGDIASPETPVTLNIRDSPSSTTIPVVSEFVSQTGSPASNAKESTTAEQSGKSQSDDNSKSGDQTNDGNNKSTSHVNSTMTTSISVNPVLPPGGISLITPASTVSATYVKIGQNATFEWHYTSLSVTPNALNVEIYCSLNSQTYTVTTGLDAKATTLVFDTANLEANQSVNLLTSKYTMYIYDQSSNVSAVPHAGYLATFEYPFGMYIPQSYTPWPGDDSYVNKASIVDPIVVKWLVGLGAVTAYSAFHIINS
jgi:hypothetical protein